MQHIATVLTETTLVLPAMHRDCIACQSKAEHQRRYEQISM